MVYKKSLLQTNLDYNQCSKPCWDHYQYGSEVSQSSRLNCYQLEVTIHLKVLVIAILFCQYQAETLHYFLSTNKQSDQKVK